MFFQEYEDYFPLELGVEQEDTKDTAAYSLGISHGVRGPVVRAVWVRLKRGRTGNLIGRVEPGEPGVGKIVINELYNTFLGEEGQLALVGITAEVETVNRTTKEVTTYFYGKHAEVNRYWSDCVNAEPLVAMAVTTARGTKEAVEHLRAKVKEELEKPKSKFKKERALPVTTILPPWVRRFTRDHVHRRSAIGNLLNK